MTGFDRPHLYADPMIFIWDNGQEFLDHAVWFIQTELDPDVIEKLLNAAVNPFSRRGGVVAVIEEPAIAWKQTRIESLEAWFTLHGDELVDWRDGSVHDALGRLPKEAIHALAARLYPSNAAIVREVLGL